MSGFLLGKGMVEIAIAEDSGEIGVLSRSHRFRITPRRFCWAW